MERPGIKDTAASLSTRQGIQGAFGLAGLILAAPNGAAKMSTLLLTVMATDTGGYAVGARLGRHPWREDQPEKTWEWDGRVGPAGQRGRHPADGLRWIPVVDRAAVAVSIVAATWRPDLSPIRGEAGSIKRTCCCSCSTRRHDGPARFDARVRAGGLADHPPADPELRHAA